LFGTFFTIQDLGHSPDNSSDGAKALMLHYGARNGQSMQAQFSPEMEASSGYLAEITRK